MKSNSRPVVARTGREKQVYDDDGSRVIAGCIVSDPLRPGLILVCSSEARPDHWIVPKGGVEIDESLEEAAIRETWEEAGVDVKLIRKLGVFVDTRPPKQWKGKLGQSYPRSKFHFYHAELQELAETWPECKTRKRSWMTPEAAVQAMLAHERTPLAHAIEAYILVCAADGTTE